MQNHQGTNTFFSCYLPKIILHIKTTKRKDGTKDRTDNR